MSSHLYNKGETLPDGATIEFTVTGEQRLSGSISMYGRQLGAIELAATAVNGDAA